MTLRQELEQLQATVHDFKQQPTFAQVQRAGAMLEQVLVFQERLVLAIEALAIRTQP